VRIFGFILIAVGLVALFYGGFSYTRHEKVLDIGPIEAYADKKEHVPLSPIAGGLAVAAGMVLVLARRRTS